MASGEVITPMLVALDASGGIEWVGVGHVQQELWGWGAAGGIVGADETPQRLLESHAGLVEDCRGHCQWLPVDTQALGSKHAEVVLEEVEWEQMGIEDQQLSRGFGGDKARARRGGKKGAHRHSKR